MACGAAKCAKCREQWHNDGWADGRDDDGDDDDDDDDDEEEEEDEDEDEDEDDEDGSCVD